MTGYHLESTAKHGHDAGRVPTQDNLLVFYAPEASAFEEAVSRMTAAGFPPVPAFNPYWDRWGRTFEDPDGYRVVLANCESPVSQSKEHCIMHRSLGWCTAPDGTGD